MGKILWFYVCMYVVLVLCMCIGSIQGVWMDPMVKFFESESSQSERVGQAQQYIHTYGRSNANRTKSNKKICPPFLCVWMDPMVKFFESESSQSESSQSERVSQAQQYTHTYGRSNANRTKSNKKICPPFSVCMDGPYGQVL